MNTTNRVGLVALFAVPMLLAASFPVGAQTLGDVGEACKTRDDCKNGLKCVNQTCVSEENQGGEGGSKGEGGAKGEGGSKSEGGSGEGGRRSDDSDGDEGRRRRRSDDDDGGERRRKRRSDDDDGGSRSSGGRSDIWGHELDSNRGMLGGILGGGPTHDDDDRTRYTTGSLLFSIKGGVFLKRVELGLEFSPATFVIDFNDPYNLLGVQLNANAGYHIKVWESISWPLRGGFGFTTPILRDTALDTLIEVRADLIGLSILLNKALIDIYFPSWRVNIDPNGNGAIFTYIFGVGGAWVPEF